MKSKREYIFVNPNFTGSSNPNSIYYVLHDVFKSDRLKAFDYVYAPINNVLLRLIKRVHFSSKINKIIKLPFKNIWKKYTDCIEWNTETEYYIILSISALSPMDPKYYMKLKKKYNIKYVLFMLEQWDSKNARNARKYYNSMDFDYVFTIYPQDEEKYGFIHTMNYYSKLFENKDVKIEYDTYHSSYVVGREELICGFIKKADENNTTYKMRLMDPDCNFCNKNDAICNTKLIDLESEITNKNNIIMNKTLPYSEIVKETMKCNCIVEILRNGLDAATNRYYEAICYNKKLITNNKNVVNLPFYNPDYIQIFEKAEDIDWNWVKERIPVDYHYDGRFSPVHIIDEIECIEKDREIVN